MTDFTRRQAVATLAVAAGTFLVPVPAVARDAHRRVREQLGAAGLAYSPTVYTAHEWATVRMLVDYIIPKDATSGSATDAGVPEFMDTMLDLEPTMRAAHRGGLAWLDHQSHLRVGKDFVDAADTDRRAMLDAIAYPARAKAAMAQGVAWFSSFRDFTATGFFTSEIGVKDVGYLGNTAVAEWTGCPDANYQRLGVTKS